MKTKTVNSVKDIKRGESAWVKNGSSTSSLYTKESSGRCYHNGVIKDNKTGKTSPIYID
jgi:hypothetical protein